MSEYSSIEKMIKTDTFIKTNIPLADTSVHKVLIAIKQNNIDYLDNLLLKLSSPDSSSYQQLNDISITSRSHNSFYIEAEASVTKWSKVLNTTFYIWKDTQYDGKGTESDHFNYHTRSVDYSLPNHLLPHITTIFNVCDAMPKMRKPVTTTETPDEHASFRGANRKLSTNNGNLVTIPFLKTYYYAQASNSYNGKYFIIQYEYFLFIKLFTFLCVERRMVCSHGRFTIVSGNIHDGS